MPASPVDGDGLRPPSNRDRAHDTRTPGLEVADDRLAADEELVDERLPGADREAACLHERPDPILSLGPDLKVVVDRRQLPVVREAPTLVSLVQLEHLVDDVHERDAKGLERAIPLPIPVGVRDEKDGQVRT